MIASGGHSERHFPSSRMDDVAADIQMSVRHQVDDYRKPFEPGVPGFYEDWWEATHQRVRADDRTEYLSFTRGHDEVARAEIDPGACYTARALGTGSDQDVVEISLIEVREDVRTSGIGRAVVADIVRRYEDRLIVATSLAPDADAFWASVGWAMTARGPAGHAVFVHEFSRGQARPPASDE